MSTPSTPTDSGTGINDAQAKIVGFLTAEEGGDSGDNDEAALLDGEELDEGDEPSDDELEESPGQGEPGDEGEEVEPDGEQDESDDETPAVPETIEIDGTPVPLEEVKKGYLRQSDYTRKTQALAEERKSFEPIVEAVRGERAQYAVLLTALEQQLKEAEQEPDWDALYAQDPVQAVRYEREFGKRAFERQQKLQAVEAERQRLNETQQNEQAEHFRAILQAEQAALAEKFPTWKDPAVAKTERAKIKAFALSIGYTEDELKTVTDHRAIVGLYKAMKYDELQQRRAQGLKPPQAKVRSMRPGAPASKPPVGKALVQAKQQLAKSGSVKDAAKSIMYLL